MSGALALARSPRAGAALVLHEGRILEAAALVAVATIVSAVHTVVSATEVPLQDLMFGPARSPAVDAMLSALGPARTSIVLLLVERSWDAILVVTALAPVLLWVLGATAVHAAARLAGVRRPFGPIFVLLGVAVGITRPVADVAGLVLGSRGAGAALAQVAGVAALVWLAVLAWNGVRAHYAVTGGQAVTILVVAAVLFYLAPLTLILLAVVAILVSAVVLDYVPAR